MEYNVLNYDWNNKEVIVVNVLRYVCDKDISKLLKQHTDFQAFESSLQTTCLYRFKSRREYEISIGDAFETDPSKLEKWDIYDQLLMNWKVFANFVWDNSQQILKEYKKK